MKRNGAFRRILALAAVSSMLTAGAGAAETASPAAETAPAVTSGAGTAETAAPAAGGSETASPAAETAPEVTSGAGTPGTAAPAANNTGTVGTAFTVTGGAVSLETNTVPRGNAMADSRSYGFPDGTRLSMQRFRTKEAGAEAQDLGKLTLSGTEGLIRWYDSTEGTWHVVPMKAGTYPAATYHLTTAQGSAILVPPQVYIDHSNGMLEHLPAYDGTLVVSETEGGFLFTVRTPALPADAHAEWFLLRSDGQLVDWNNPESASKWSIYRFTGDNRWCMTGYYYRAPDSYYPAGENYYNNLPAAYIAGRMMRDENQPASMYLGLAMLDVMAGLRNAEGYLPSLSGSIWLRDDYGIGPGYFDTRFNVDLATAQYYAVKRYGVQQWTADLIRFGDYLCRYSQQHHFPYDYNGASGWLVHDYAHPDGNRPTHCSLNHQAAMAVFLYRLTELTGETRFADMAELLTRGIEHSATGWIKEDGDLHYSFMPDRTYGRTDYAYLTYNDLLELQTYVTNWRSGMPSTALQMLLNSKRQWMDAHGVTDYNK